ncbi:aldehyde dehydrogenase [Microbacterium sp. Root61]|uniref:aldehyde dehydrogenase family protein n=1 Tax=Microbacterium sp. Root61 TaxID=1736570 RepID=UPI0006FA2F11|nr:aldehyde dehydrogenase family protein [Microbacterium sp. Root61]KRA24759.1 aldehyde dehydrogenase [Microbacterium sp. Root61]
MNVAAGTTLSFRNFIGGAWGDVAGTERRPLVSPFDGSPVGDLPISSAEDVDAAVRAAEAALPVWSALPIADRAAALRGFAARLGEHSEELAQLERVEMGKPAAIGQMFIEGAIGGFERGIAEAESYAFETVNIQPDGTRTTIRRTPVGVTALIVPWNFTVPAVLGALAPLLMSGNPVILKPSEKASLSALRLMELADLPAGVLSLLLGDGRTGAMLNSHPGIALTHFTGSVASGRAVAAASGQALHRCILELGGKDAAVIDEDVDIEAVAEAVAEAGFVNTGQICTSIERVYVHEAVAERFTTALVQHAQRFTAGDPDTDYPSMGPMVDTGQREIVHAHVQDAVAQGARVVVGGAVPDRLGAFYPATVLTGLTDGMRIMNEETFGPVIPVVTVASFDEGIRRAQHTDFGLAATVYTDNPHHQALAADLPVGIVWINQWQGGNGHIYEPARNSGMGATGGHDAFDAATRAVTVAVAHPPRSA